MKVSEVWTGIDHLRPVTTTLVEWKQTYEGAKAALTHIGLELVTNKTQFHELEIPKNRDGKCQYQNRKVIVSRNNVLSSPTMINNLLRGHSSLQTSAEKLQTKELNSRIKSRSMTKGTCSTHNKESEASLALDTLLQLDKDLRRVVLFENRLADVAYSLLVQDSTIPDQFAPDQVKSAKADKHGRLTFNHEGTVIKAKGMISILEKGMSLTMIGKNSNNEPEVVWLFDQIGGLSMLRNFPETQPFQPRLHLKTTSYTPFTVACNKPEFRFDISKSDGEVLRLQQRRIQLTRMSPKFTLQYLNEDDSQIPGGTHRIELKSFQLTRQVCQENGANVEHIVEDSYGPIDFRMNRSIRIQDKVGERRFCMRQVGRHPYDPDSFDILQVTSLINKTIYAIPMRHISNGLVQSYFSEQELLASHIYFTETWRAEHTKFKYDFNDNSSVKQYIEACKAAHKVPKLTNRNFFEDLLNKNRSRFGSKKALAIFSELD